MDVLTGFHGKLPVAGDFLTRGLPSGFVAFWDAWAAHNLARREGWPEGGLRLRLESGGRVAAAIVIPGADRVGRRFPLSAFVIAPALPDPPGLDPWCDAALHALLRAQGEGLSPDLLDDLLLSLDPPEGEGEPAAMTLWARGETPAACDPSEPEAVLAHLFSCSGSSSL